MSGGISLGAAIALLGVLLCGTTGAFAGGYFLPHQTARGVALSNALTAGVDDPSAVYYNPAALSEVKDNQLLLTGSYINIINSVENSGHKTSNHHPHNVTGSFFGNYRLPAGDITLGLGVYTPFGLVTSYARGFTRFAARETELKTYYLTPAVSWNPSKFFSVGGGVSFVHASAVLSRSLCFVSVPGGCGAEEKLRIADSANAYSYNAGVLIKPTDAVKIGFSYRGRADLHFDNAKTKVNGAFGPAKAKANVRPIPLPPVIDAGLFWQINPLWGAEFVYEFQQWSEFNATKASFSQPLPPGFSTFTLPRNWKNTSTVRFGSFYRVIPEWELRGGLTLEESPMPNRTLTPSIPGADLLTLNAGFGYKWEKAFMDFGYQAVFYKTRKVRNSELEGAGAHFLGAPGKDKHATFNNFVSLSLGYRF
jgi:long-chain fatty acid transport protein